MKVFTETKVFQPVTLVIESQAELDYLVALSNSSMSQVRSSAKSIGFELSREAESFQDTFYTNMLKLKIK